MSSVRLARAGASLLVVLCLAASTAAEAKKKKDDAKKEPADPELKLTVSTHHGFIPFPVILSASLTGVDPDDEQFCHAGIEWESTSPFGLTSTSKRDPRCLHPPEETEIRLTFSKTIVLRRAGLYRYRLILHKRNGEILYSNTQEIRAMYTGG